MIAAPGYAAGYADGYDTGRYDLSPRITYSWTDRYDRSPRLSPSWPPLPPPLRGVAVEPVTVTREISPVTVTRTREISPVTRERFRRYKISPDIVVKGVYDLADVSSWLLFRLSRKVAAQLVADSASRRCFCTGARRSSSYILGEWCTSRFVILTRGLELILTLENFRLFSNFELSVFRAL